MTGIIRLFVSINIPDEIREGISALETGLPEDRLNRVKKEDMHLTMKFIGEVQSTKLDKINEKLGTISFKPMQCKVRGVGVFPNEKYVRVLWTGVECKELEELASKIISELDEFGGDTKFSPHITIARVRQRIDPGKFLEHNANTEFGTFTIKAFQLVQSILSMEGPQYKVVAEFHAKEE